MALPGTNKARPLRIAIDAHMIGEQETGNETYMINLIRGLSSVDRATRYYLYSPHPESLALCGPLAPNFTIRRVWPGTAPVRIPFALPLRTATDGIDLLHVTYIAPPLVSAAVVATVHDISYVLYPETFSQRDRLVLGTLVPPTLRKARMIITVSESSRRDIARHYNTPEDKIVVVYQPISSAFHRVTDEQRIAATLSRYGISRPYILAVGNLQPRKNLPRLVRAFAHLRKSGTYTGHLVLVGRTKWRESSVFQEIRALGLEREVILTGYVPEAEVVDLFNSADTFVYPSLYEGFGLPPLEAMACGCPVVTSNASSLLEVVGDAGVMVDPFSEAGLAQAIWRVLHDDHLRRTLIARGHERVQRFTAERATQDTLAVYEQARSAREPHR